MSQITVTYFGYKMRKLSEVITQKLSIIPPNHKISNHLWVNVKKTEKNEIK